MLNKIRGNKVLKVIGHIIEGLCYAVIIMYLLVIIFQRLSSNSALFGYRFFTVATGSMIPTYEVGDVLVVKEVPLSSLAVGDDIAYLGATDDFEGKIVTHRITDIEGDTIITQGLANPTVDPAINYSQVYGKVIYKLLFISFISSLVHNQYGFFFLIFIPLVLIIFLEVVDTSKEIKDLKDEKKQ